MDIDMMLSRAEIEMVLEHRHPNPKICRKILEVCS